MRYCALENHTLIAYATNYDYIMSVRSNQLIGALGRCIDQILCPLVERKCKIIGETHLGTKLDNGTYTGALGLMQSGKGDSYLKDILINEPFIERGTPLRAENLWASQVLSSEEKELEFFDLLENFKFTSQIYLCYFSSLIFFGLTCFGLFRLKMRSNDNFQNRNLLSKFFYVSNYLKRCKEFSFEFIFLCLGLFFWFTLLFVANTIKTNKVVVDTSELIKDKDELMKLDFVCFFKDDTAYNLAINSPKNSFLYKLINEKTKFDDKKHSKEISILKNDRCFIPDKTFSANYFTNKIILTTEIEMMGGLIYVSAVNIIKKVWIIKKIKEYNVVTYSNAYVNEFIKKIVKKIKYDNNEHGISKKMYDCMMEGCESLYRKTLKVYGDINDYIEDYTGFSNLELGNFESLFIIYFFLLGFIFVAFILFRIVPFYYPKFVDFTYSHIY